MKHLTFRACSNKISIRLCSESFLRINLLEVNGNLKCLEIILVQRSWRGSFIASCFIVFPSLLDSEKSNLYLFSNKIT